MTSSLDDQAAVRRQYRDERGLLTRASIWRPPVDGVTPQDLVIAELGHREPTSILEIGCGTGALAERIHTSLPAASMLATDQSARMVELTAARGVPAVIADADDLPFAAGSYQAVVAAWMLYHVPRIDHTLTEVRRVLADGGVFIAVTNGNDHLAGLLGAAGASGSPYQFGRENGEALLRHHFGTVEARHLTPLAVANHAEAVRYLASSQPEAAARLPRYDGERTYRGAVTVFIAS